MTHATQKRLRRLAIFLAAVVAILVSAWIFRAPLLSRAASAWTVDEPIKKGDAIAVLGGGAQYRAFEAARLYEQGVAPKVLVMRSGPGPWETSQTGSREAELIRKVLIHE